MAKQQINGWVVLVIALLAYAFVPAVQDAVNGIFGQTGPTAPPAGGGQTITCPIEDTTVQVDTHNKYSRGSEITNGAHRVFVNGVDRGYVAEGGTFTASPGQSYKIIAGENSTSAYSVIKEGTIPCQGTLDIAAGLATYDSSLTTTVWNENGQVMSTTQNQNMAADAVYSLPFKISVTSKQSFGNPDHPGKGNILCIMMNKSAFDTFEVDGATKAPVPNQVTTGSTNSTSCYYIPVIQNDPNVVDGTSVSSLVVDGKYEGTIIIDTSSSYVDGVAQNASFIVVDTALDLDGDSLAEIFDVEDETNNDLAVTALQEVKLNIG